MDTYNSQTLMEQWKSQKELLWLLRPMLSKEYKELLDLFIEKVEE